MQVTALISSALTELIDRELSWLDFNHRVMEEARDPSVPLLERLRFLAIFSANLDEFFRVRVAALRTVLRDETACGDAHAVATRSLLRTIHRTVHRHQEEFGEILWITIGPALRRAGIRLHDHRTWEPSVDEAIRDAFRSSILTHVPPPVELGAERPFLKDRQLYLIVELDEPARRRYGLVEIATPPLNRFVVTGDHGAGWDVVFLDDVLRSNLSALFPNRTIGESYAVKLSRDAELALEDEFEGHIADHVRRGLARREQGMPCRFLVDEAMPAEMRHMLIRLFDLDPDDLVPGGRYHNLHDLADFPSCGIPDLAYPAMPAHPHRALSRATSRLAAIGRRDHVLHYPYQSFDYVIELLREAANDQAVEEIFATLYRTASPSQVVSALTAAARSGKRVSVFVEVMARFDEATNLRWAAEMEAAGVRTYYSKPGVKVHAKLLLISRREDGRMRDYAYLATGNLNEKTARFYTDHGLLTSDRRLTQDVRIVFDYLTGRRELLECRHLMVAPSSLRSGLQKLIAREISHAREGRPARIIMKLNNLEDAATVRELYRAAEAGVDVELIVRGICRLAIGEQAATPRLKARRLVDRFLEHGRVFIFHNAGSEEIYLASADLMTRNLDRRIEVATPIYDPAIRRELRNVIDIQLADNVKARPLTPETCLPNGAPVRAQMEIYSRLGRSAPAAPLVTAAPEPG